jgi:hypothetical protein
MVEEDGVGSGLDLVAAALRLQAGAGRPRRRFARPVYFRTRRPTIWIIIKWKMRPSPQLPHRALIISPPLRPLALDLISPDTAPHLLPLASP